MRNATRYFYDTLYNRLKYMWLFICKVIFSWIKVRPNTCYRKIFKGITLMEHTVDSSSTQRINANGVP